MKKQKHVVRIILCFILIALMLPFTGKLTGVFAASSDIKLNVKSTNIIRGYTFTLNVYNTEGTDTLTFKSADESIATVEEDGTICGIACGTTRITVTVTDETGRQVAKLRCKVTVGLPAISVKFTKSEIEMYVGMKRALKTLIQPGNSIEKPQFYSEDTSIVTVTNSGRITAKSAGSTYVYAILGNGKYDTCIIIVNEEPVVEPTVTVEPEPDYEDTTPSAITSAPTATPTSAPTATLEPVNPLISNSSPTDNMVPAGSVN